MNAAEVLTLAFDGLHEAIREDFVDAPGNEELFTQPIPGLNHPGFLLWHLVRDEDLVTHHVRGGETLWVAEGWHSRAGFGRTEQGTGFATGRAAELRYELPDFMAYAERVWSSTRELLRGMSEADLEGPGYGEWNAARLLLDGCLGHGWLHLGEIRYARGIGGWRARE